MTGESRTSARRARSIERRRLALELRKQGLSYNAIGERLGVSRQHAQKLVARELESIKRQAAEDAEAVRQIELQRLDDLFKSCYDQAINGDLAAVDRCLKIMEQRARLTGINAVSRQEMSLTLAASPEWQELRGRILMVLERFPDARMALLAELGGQALPAERENGEDVT